MLGMRPCLECQCRWWGGGGCHCHLGGGGHVVDTEGGLVREGVRDTMRMAKVSTVGDQKT